MQKRTGIIVLIVILTLQLSVPIGIITTASANEWTARTKGEVYKLAISSISYREGNVKAHISVSDKVFGRTYAVLVFNKDGTATLDGTLDKPVNSVYIKTDGDAPVFNEKVPPIPEFDESYIGTYFYNKSIYPENTDYPGENARYFENGYVEVYIYDGKYTMKNILINGSSVSDFLSTVEQINN